jgi:tetratricopeptide (TPR) repeat protein
MKRILLLNLFFTFFLFLSCYSQDNLAHEDTIRTILFSPDNKLIITEGDDHMVRVWDMNEGRMRNAFIHGYPINKIFIHPKGNLMITGNGSSYHCLWDLKKGKVLKCFTDHRQVEGFTSDGKHIVVVEYGNDGKRFATLGLISVELYEYSVLPHKIYVDSLLQNIYFTPDGKDIVLVSGKNMWILKKDKPFEKINHKLKEVTQEIAISPDGKFFTHHGSRYVYDLQSGKPVLELEENISPDPSTLIKYSVDGKLITVISGKEINTFKTDSGKVEKKFITTKTFILKISPDLNKMAYSESGKDLKIQNIKHNVLPVSFNAPDILRKISYRNYLKGVRSYNDRKYEEAVNFFTLSLKNNYYYEKVYYFRGQAFLYTGKTDKAISDFLEDEKIIPGRSSYNLARAYSSNKDFDRCIEALNKNQSSLYRKISGVLLKDNFFKTLHKDPRWANLISDQSTNSGQLADQANAMLAKGNIPAAKSLIDLAINDDPKNSEWYKMRAELYIKTGEYDEAIKDFRKELQLDSGRLGEVYHNIAVAYVKKGDMGRAAIMLKEIVRLDSSQFHLLLDLAEMEMVRYNREKAIEYINTYLHIMSDDYEAYYLRADFLGGEEAKRDINKAIALCKQQGHKVPKTYYDLLSSIK